MANGLPDKVVTLTLDANGYPVPDVDTVTVKKNNQKVRWCADFDFQIQVDGYTDLTYGSAGAACRFRCTTGTFPDVKKYKYSITANGKVTDPYVEVTP